MQAHAPHHPGGVGPAVALGVQEGQAGKGGLNPAVHRGAGAVLVGDEPAQLHAGVVLPKQLHRADHGLGGEELLRRRRGPHQGDGQDNGVVLHLRQGGKFQRRGLGQLVQQHLAQIGATASATAQDAAPQHGPAAGLTVQCQFFHTDTS